MFDLGEEAHVQIREVGAICLSCGHRQSKMSEPGVKRDFFPVDWESAKLIDGP